jgi:hypothetical protein
MESPGIPGRFSVPGMIAVLSDGPAELHTQAGLVLTFNGVSVVGGGDDENPTWTVTLLDGDTMTVSPHFHLGPDGSDTAWGEPPHTLDAKDSRKLFLQYALLFAVSIVLAVAAYLTHGIAQPVLAVLAGILFAVALWATLFLTVVRIFQKNVDRFTRDA